MGTEVKLSKSYTVNGTTFDTIVMRDPTYADVFMSGLGEPSEWQPSKSGMMRLVYSDVIDKYLQRLVQAPAYELLHEISATDALRLQEAVCGFFMEKPDVSKRPTS